MSDETRHPERRAGQRTATGYGCTYGDKPGGPWCPAHDEGEDGWKLWDDGVSTGMKAGEALCPGHADAPATPQPSAPVVGRACKAWCGMRCRDVKDTEFRARARGCLGCEDVRWCSQACFHANLPPLAAQPAGVKRCMGQCMENVGTFDRPAWKVCAECGVKITAQIAAAKAIPKPAKQPKPAAKAHDFSDPYCARRYEGAVVRLCVDCGTFETTPVRECGTVGPMWRVDFERWVGKKAAGILRDPATPERIVKPPMAHVAGSHDDDLIGCAR